MRYATAALLFVALAALVGCGGGRGGDSNHEVDTGSPAGDLRAVQITPAPGRVFITDGTGFRIAWPAESPPPANFSVELFRYKEGYTYKYEDSDGTSHEVEVERDTEGKDSHFERQEDEPYTWILDPDGDMEDGGVYYLLLRSDSDEVRASYIVEGGRALPARSTPASNHTVRTR